MFETIACAVLSGALLTLSGGLALLDFGFIAFLFAAVGVYGIFVEAPLLYQQSVGDDARSKG